jgi:hypothetical protein
MFRELIAHLQEVLHKHFVYCAHVIGGLEFYSNPGAASSARNMYKLSVNNKFNANSVSRWFYCAAAKIHFILLLILDILSMTF